MEMRALPWPVYSTKSMEEKRPEFWGERKRDLRERLARASRLPHRASREFSENGNEPYAKA
jgi:hypothetical protein